MLLTSLAKKISRAKLKAVSNIRSDYIVLVYVNTGLRMDASQATKIVRADVCTYAMRHVTSSSN